MFADAVEHHPAGRLVEAEDRYRRILAVDPGHIDSLHLVGGATFQAGRFDVAIDLIAFGTSLSARSRAQTDE